MLCWQVGSSPKPNLPMHQCFVVPLQPINQIEHTCMQAARTCLHTVTGRPLCLLFACSAIPYYAPACLSSAASQRRMPVGLVTGLQHTDGSNATWPAWLRRMLTQCRCNPIRCDTPRSPYCVKRDDGARPFENEPLLTYVGVGRQYIEFKYNRHETAKIASWFQPLPTNMIVFTF
jgi:hypothetical protein